MDSSQNELLANLLKLIEKLPTKQDFDALATRIDKLEQAIIQKPADIKEKKSNPTVAIKVTTPEEEETEADKKSQELITKLTLSISAYPDVESFNKHFTVVVQLVTSLNDDWCLKLMASISQHVALHCETENLARMIAVLARCYVTVQHSLLKQQASSDLSYIIRHVKNKSSIQEQDTLLLSICFVLMGLIVQQEEEAKRFFDEAIKECSTFGYAYFCRGVLQQTMYQDVASAMTDYQSSIQYCPFYGYAHFNLAFCHVNFMADYQKALEHYNAGIACDPKNAVAYNNRGYLYEMNLGQYDLALADYNKALEVDDKNTCAYLNIGHFHANHLKQYHIALEWYQKILSYDPQNAQVFYHMGKVYHYHLKEYNTAMEYYTKSIAMDNNQYLAYYERAQLYVTFYKDFEKAIKDYTKAIQINKHFALGYQSRALVYHVHVKNYKLALEDYTRSLKCDDKNVQSWFNRGQVFELLQDKERAERDYEKAKRLDPSNDVIAQALQQVQQALGTSTSAQISKARRRKKQVTNQTSNVANGPTWSMDPNLNEPATPDLMSPFSALSLATPTTNSEGDLYNVKLPFGNMKN